MGDFCTKLTALMATDACVLDVNSLNALGYTGSTDEVELSQATRPAGLAALLVEPNAFLVFSLQSVDTEFRGTIEAATSPERLAKLLAELDVA